MDDQNKQIVCLKQIANAQNHCSPPRTHPLYPPSPPPPLLLNERRSTGDDGMETRTRLKRATQRGPTAPGIGMRISERNGEGTAGVEVNEEKDTEIDPHVYRNYKIYV